MEGAKKELAEKGFAEVEIIGKQIFNKGGIKNYI